jgi:Lactate dehydrogenase and related dehydrogenases
MAEHFVLLALGVCRRAKEAGRWLGAGDWSKTGGFTSVEISGKTLGVLGFGNIGREVAQMCSAAFGMPILYASRQAHEEEAAALRAERVTYEQLFARSDVIAVCQALTPETRHLVDAGLLNLMKPTAFIVNVSRGAVWKEEDLVRALKEGRLAGAASDVYETEPLPADHPLLGLDNFFGTPHLGGLTAEAIRRNSLEAAEGVLDVLAGRQPQFIVV